MVDNAKCALILGAANTAGLLTVGGILNGKINGVQSEMKHAVEKLELRIPVDFLEKMRDEIRRLNLRVSQLEQRLSNSKESQTQNSPYISQNSSYVPQIEEVTPPKEETPPPPAGDDDDVDFVVRMMTM
jgi:hypothetical protein